MAVIRGGVAMKKLLTICAVFALKTCSPCPAAELTERQVDALAAAIYKAEGGAKARAPYGILSVKVSGEAEARRVCENTIRNNYKRWTAAGSRGRFSDYLADKYCPPSVDKIGNLNWKSNVAKLWKDEAK